MAKQPDQLPPEHQAADDSLIHSLRHSIEPEEGDLPGDVTPPLGPIAVLVRRIVLIGVLPLFAAFYLEQALTIPLPNRELIVSPRGFPTFVGVLMVVVTIILSITEIRKVLKARKADRATVVEGTDDDDTERITSWKDAWVTLLSLCVYVAVFSFLGFFISTTVFLIGLSTYFSRDKWLRNIIVSVLFSLAVFLLFSNLLQVRLPAGLLSGLF
jgi:putative tricarboxylic transport membrane protein